MKRLSINGMVSQVASMFAFVALALILAVSGGHPVQAQDSNPAKVADEMVKAWNELNLDKIVNTFAEDGVLHSVMVAPIKGRDHLREHLGAFLNGATRLELKIKKVAVVGNTVFLERVDDFDYKGKHGAVPVVGVMDIKNGKVQEWREYYDRASLLKEMGLDTPAPAKN